jgi:uncharacterized protein
MPTSVSQYVLKVASRCDLACDHCYVYEHADQSWRTKPKAITLATVRQAAKRISHHARIHQLSDVHIVLHGGEPLLLGRDGLSRTIRTLRALIDPVTRLDLRIHTNGVLLDEELCTLFADHGVQVGVSLDGDRAANDRHRLFANGRSSFSHVQRALALLRKPQYRHVYAGILCTIDVANDPIAVYEALLTEAPPRVDFLLPHATWDHPPHRPPGQPRMYAEWLGRIHSRWVADNRPMPIRFFDSLLAAWEGRPSQSEAAGLDPADLLVIETDGSWEQTDSLKTAFENAPATGFNIFTHSVDEAAAHPAVASRQTGITALCQTCRDCELVQACGGGLYTHRYKADNGFDNPSVYCDDLKELIPRIIRRSRVAPAVSGERGGSVARHSMPEAVFDLLSAGPGDVAGMAVLTDSHWSIVRALIADVARELGGKGGDLNRAATEGWALLADLDAERPEAVRAVVSYPYVRAWAMRCLEPASHADLELDRAHVAGLAAAAALRAGTEAELLLPVREGAVYLPTMGALAVEPGAGPTTAVRVSPAGVRCRHGTGSWETVRWLTGGDKPITVEDIDPFRDCQAWSVAGRLPPETWNAWRLALMAAVRELTTELPDYARVMSAGLRSVVPLGEQPAGYRQSSTPRQAFGAVALTLPGTVAGLSELLVHEMQHVKLTALGDLFDLVDPADDTVLTVPWRDDPRPIEAALHGAYAYLAVAELWRSRSGLTLDAEARVLFRRYRSWVEEGIEALLSAGSLMPRGEQFVKGMRSTVDAWADDG